MNPLMRFALAHPEQPPLPHLEARGFQLDQDKPQSRLGGRQRTVLVRCVPTSRAPLPVKAPVGHLALERDLKGRDPLLKFVHGETGHIEHFGRASLQIDEPSRAHSHGPRSLEAQDTINREQLYFLR
jgi:hypothetical protein